MTEFLPIHESSPASRTEVIPVSLPHLEPLTEFLQVAYADTYPNDNGTTREMFENNTFREHLRAYLEAKLTNPHSTLFAARLDGQITGTFGITRTPDADIAEVWGFYVGHESQGRGIGQKLWTTLMSDEASQGVRTLVLSVAKTSTKAIAFYERQGFTTAWDETWQWPSWTEEKPHNEYWKMYKRV